MISSFSFFLLVSASKHSDRSEIELGLMISKSLMESVEATRHPIDFQMGLHRGGRSRFRNDFSSDQVCYLNKITKDTRAVVDDYICGDDITRRYLVGTICGRGESSCFKCNSNFVKINGPDVEISKCIPPAVERFDLPTVSHVCHSTMRSFGICESPADQRTCGGLYSAYSSNINEREKNQFNYECCKIKLTDPKNKVQCSPKGYKSREIELSIEKNSGKIVTMHFSLAMPKRCCADI